jgi:hypothetical protein
VAVAGAQSEKGLVTKKGTPGLVHPLALKALQLEEKGCRNGRLALPCLGLTFLF